jgi:hypothetical protein
VSEKQLKLTIELVPRALWLFSLREIYKQSGQMARWKKIKNNLFETEGRRCWICGQEGNRLEAHEFWEYDDVNHIQKLVAIHHLCSMCHRVKHIGFWCSIDRGMQQMARMGLTKQDLIRHFCEVNSCSREEFEEHEEESFVQWRERSNFEWRQDLGAYAPDAGG